ncbi:MAG TPA: aminotransferase class I/II-fold pyridoxal phosphate-dependent enzyme, partial [Candidatus Paceibacterota bacterium]|nr:aminotransferase class I/II-fold pyridoxal phosphate-dependent enzyme [Candidatus Paceibacterota bacterium]
NSGSEANEVAVLLSKQKTGRSIVVASNLAHSSVSYAAKKFGSKIESFDVDQKTFQVSNKDLIEFLKKQGKRVAMLNVVYGTTQLGTSEDFILDKQVQKLCKKQGIWVHIDAAFGALYLNNGIVPKQWRAAFALADSVTVDAYKMAGLPTSGALFLKHDSYKALLDQEVTYFKGTTTALGTTRSVLSVATSLDLFKKLKAAGLRKLAQEQNRKADYVRRELTKQGKELFVDDGSIIVVIKVSNEKILDQKLRSLKKKGFDLSSVKMQTSRYSLYGLRLTLTTKPETNWATIKKFVIACKTI